MRESTTWVAIDDHKSQLTIAVRGDDDTRSAPSVSIPNDDAALRRWWRRLRRRYPRQSVRICYEAGPNGFALKRRLEAIAAVHVDVVAPSLTPRRSGSRVKTDRRDAARLVELYRAGELTPITTPDADDEAARDLVRLFHTLGTEITRKRHHISKFLLRRGRIWRSGRNWTQAHRAWLQQQHFDAWPDELAFTELLSALDELEARRARLRQALDRLAADERRALTVALLSTFHGIDTPAALTLQCELFSFGRFPNARHLMSYLGLTPSVHQSGGCERRGPISRSGNRYVRWVLGQVAWHYRHRPQEGVRLARRRRGAPPWALEIARRAQRRLHHRYWALVQRGKTPNKAVTAVARELVGFIWELGQQIEQRSNEAARSAA